VSARVIALDALVRVEEGAYAHVAVPAALASTSLSARDRAFVTDLVYGTVRAQRRLDDLVGRVLARPARRLDPPVRAALRMGAYQLVRGLPAHAAVGETVEALGARSPRAKGFVNANLRALTRLGPPWPESDDPAVALSYPDWIVERLTRDLGPVDAPRALAAMNEPASVTLRPNVRVATGAALADELRAGAAEGSGIEVERGSLVADALRVRGVGDPARLPAVAEGRATPQDEGSQAVVAALAPAPGERIADVAAAPGGTATAIAERGGPDGVWSPSTWMPVAAGSWPRRGASTSVAARGWPTAAARCARCVRPVLLDAVLGIGVLRRRATPVGGSLEVIECAALNVAAAAAARWCAPVVCSCTRCARPSPRRRPRSTTTRVGSCPASSPSRRRAARGGRTAAARCCSRTIVAPTACSCCCSGHRAARSRFAN
jgi:transcription termination factor NusB